MVAAGLRSGRAPAAARSSAASGSRPCRSVIAVKAYARPALIAGIVLAALAGSAQAQAQPQAQRANLMALHDALHLTPDQEPAWRAYLAATAPDPQADARRQAAVAMIPNLPTPRRIDLITAAMQQDLDAFRREGAAVKAFYAILTPAQRATFDRQTLQLGGGAQPR